MTIARRRIFLMRHGSVTYFDEAGKPHLPESVPLNADGRAQADAAGHAFASAGVRGSRSVQMTGFPAARRARVTPCATISASQ